MKKILLSLLIFTSIIYAQSLAELEFEGVTKNKMNWYKAVEYCKNLNKNSKEDWRLPNLFELAKYAYEAKKRESTLNNPSYYWSALTYPHYKKAAWFVSFSETYQHFSVKTNTLYVECVRTK